MTIGDLVASERRRLRTRLLFAGVALAAAGAVALAAAGGLALGGSRWLALPRALPWLVWLLAIATIVAVALRARRRMRHDAAPARVAAAIEEERSLRPGQVRGAMEVAGTGPLGALAAEQVAHRLAHHQGALAPALQQRATRRATIAGAAAVAAVVAVTISAAMARDGFAALLHPAAAWDGSLLPPLRFSGLPHALVRGERLRVRVDAPGRRAIRVSHRLTGRPWEQVEALVGRDGRAIVDVGPLDADVILTATDGRAHADTARVSVTERAFLGDVAVRAQYPVYLGRPAETLASATTLRVPRGTALGLSGRASTELSDVAIAAGTAVNHLATSGHGFEGRMVADASARWAWRAIGAGGPVADVPAPLDIEVIPDSLPLIAITSPSTDSTVDGLGAVHVSLAASDDHGLAQVALRIWRERADGVREAPLDTRLAGAQAAWAGEALVDLAARSLAPGDKLHVLALATDASPWRQIAASRELVLRVPSTTELRATARASADSTVARAVAAAQAQRELQQRTGDAARSREGTRSSSASSAAPSASAGGDKSMSFAAAERAKGLAQEQRKLGDRVQSLQDQAKALERQLKQAGALDSSLASQLADVQRLLRDALTPEMAKQLQSLDQNANRLSSSDSRQALEQLAEQQRALRQQLEKSVEMLRRAALEGAMQTLRDEAKDLAQAQTQEAQRLAGTPPPNAARDAQSSPSDRSARSDKSQELADRSRALTQDVEQLTKKLQSEKADVGAQRAAEASRHADASADAMERAARQDDAKGRQEPRPVPRDAANATPDMQRAEQSGARQSGEPQAGQQGAAQKQTAAQRQAGAQQQGAQQQGGQQQAGQQQSGQQQGGQQGGEQQGAQQRSNAARSAQDAAGEMQQAADQLASARKGQIDAWKNELSGELDQAIQEVMQMAREQSEVEQQARAGADPSSLRSAQGAVQQGVEQTAQKLEQAGRKSSLLSQRAQRSVGEARQQVTEATQALQQPGGTPGGEQGGNQPANAMREAGESLNRAAAALVRDRERVNGAQSASGFGDMIAQMRELAKQQGQINSQASGLPLPTPGQSGGGGNQAARQLAKQQRGVADKLEELGDGDPSGRSDALAKEARQLAQQLERDGADPRTAQRQQQLYRRLLDAGRTLEQDERDETGKREARSGAGVSGIAPADGSAAGRAASKYQAPDWTQLRGLSADERRLVIEYFRRLNATPGTPP